MDTLSEDDELKKFARLDTEYTLMRIEPNTIVSTTKKNFTKVSGMVLTP